MGGMLAKDMSIVDEGNGKLALKLPHLNLSAIPERVLNADRAQLRRIVKIDLTHNKFSDIDFIRHFPNLEDLYMDSNRITHLTHFPAHSKLTGLSLNRNLIGADSKGGTMCVDRMAAAYPKMRFLSLIHNPGCPSYFIGSAAAEAEAFRSYCICKLPLLSILDSTNIAPEEREVAEDELGAELGLRRSKARDDASVASKMSKKAARSQASLASLQVPEVSAASSASVHKASTASVRESKAEKKKVEKKSKGKVDEEVAWVEPAEVCGTKRKYACSQCPAALYLEESSMAAGARCPACAAVIVIPSAVAPPPVPPPPAR